MNIEYACIHTCSIIYAAQISNFQIEVLIMNTQRKIRLYFFLSTYPAIQDIQGIVHTYIFKKYITLNTIMQSTGPEQYDIRLKIK